MNKGRQLFPTDLRNVNEWWKGGNFSQLREETLIYLKEIPFYLSIKYSSQGFPITFENQSDLHADGVVNWHDKKGVTRKRLKLELIPDNM